MDISPPVDKRNFLNVDLKADFVVVGGGLAGFCAAVGAARDGLSVILIQDRPVLGGNASSEVRVWALGATSHMGNNNRWAREGGVMGEIMEENLYRNKDGNPVMFDLVLQDMARSEPNLTLLMNTSADAVEKEGRRITRVKAFNAMNQTVYIIEGKLFCDASGDGMIAFLGGAEFRSGAEKREEFDEGMAPGDNFGQLLGHSIFFTTQRMEKPVNFVPPSFALDDIRKIPRYKRLSSKSSGAGDLWWLEWGGGVDTIHDNEIIKWELLKIVWGAWDYIKNSGEFPDAANLTIDWVGSIPGKRESRRFIGDYMLNQKDVIEQIDHPDAISYGGWSIDLHPADGVYSEMDGCVQFHSKGTYTIPYRCYYSKDLDNLFLAGRIISASHVAFGSARTMATCALGGEVTGRAAVYCLRNHLMPEQVGEPSRIADFRQYLMFGGFYIPRQKVIDPGAGAEVSASSCFALTELVPDGSWFVMSERLALMLPLKKGERLPKMDFLFRADGRQDVGVSLLLSEKPFNHTPETVAASMIVSIEGEGYRTVDLDYRADCDRYVFVAFEVNEKVSMARTAIALPGIMTVFNSLNLRVAKHARQVNDGDYGIDEFDFWLPKRRPHQFLPALRLHGALACYDPAYVLNGAMRPGQHTNAWVPASGDPMPWIQLSWPETRALREVVIVFDNDFDNAMETVHMEHPDPVGPHCVRHYRLMLDGVVLADVGDNRHSVCIHRFAAPLDGKRLRLEAPETGGVPPAVYALHVR